MGRPADGPVTFFAKPLWHHPLGVQMPVPTGPGPSSFIRESLQRLATAGPPLAARLLGGGLAGALGLVGALGAALVGCGGARNADARPTAAGLVDAEDGDAAARRQEPRLAAAPPDFELDTLDGGSLRLGDHLGTDVVLLDFWATYCDPCLTSMPHLEALYRKYHNEGFIVLGISIDGPDSVARVRMEVGKMGVTFPILLDQETRVVALYNPRTSAPYSVLIGRDGRVLSRKEGYTTGDDATLEREIRAALAQ